MLDWVGKLFSAVIELQMIVVFYCTSDIILKGLLVSPTPCSAHEILVWQCYSILGDPVHILHVDFKARLTSCWKLFVHPSIQQANRGHNSPLPNHSHNHAVATNTYLGVLLRPKTSLGLQRVSVIKPWLWYCRQVSDAPWTTECFGEAASERGWMTTHNSFPTA
jgi:hypothetical protein